MDLKLVICAALLSVVAADDVLDLSADNFDDVVAQHDVMLIEFFAPWCGHCKRLAPEYEKAATQLKKADPAVPLAKVDCPANTDLCQRFGVSGYPSLKIFRNGEFSKDYNGPRETDGIVKYMRTETGPASRQLSTESEFDKFVDHFEHSVVGFFSDPESDLAKSFHKMADQMKEQIRFAHALSEELHKKFKDRVVIFQPKRLHTKLQPTEHACSSDADKLSELKNCLRDNLHGAVGHRTTGNDPDFKQPLVNVYWEVDYVRNPKGSNYWRNRIIKVAEKFKDEEVNFAFSSWDDFEREMEEFGKESKPEGKDAKPIVTAKDSKGQKYAMDNEFSVDNLHSFVTDFIGGKLEPYLKSEEVPESNDEGVKVLVGKNFDSIVNDADKDVLIEFYAPWCGHCKKLEPIFSELGDAMKDEPGIVIAKMDATANDVPAPYNVRGFPTLYFKKKGDQMHPLEYSGDRELDGFVKYLAKEATDELVGYTRSGDKKEGKTEL